MLQMDWFSGSRNLLVAVLLRKAAMLLYVLFEVFSPYLDAASKLHTWHLSASERAGLS